MEVGHKYGDTAGDFQLQTSSFWILNWFHRQKMGVV